METGLKDVNGNVVKVGDVLLNPMCLDLWNVEIKKDFFTANLIPNSGLFIHPNNDYPQCTEDLEDICEVFKICKLNYKGYDGTVKYSVADKCLHGTILFINDLVTYEGYNLPELETAFYEAVDDYIEFKNKI